MKKLDLSGSYIVDVSPLAGLVNLTVLVLNNNQIVDVTPLAGLVKISRISTSIIIKSWT